MEAIDFILPLVATLGAFLGCYLRPSANRHIETIHPNVKEQINVVPSPSPKKSKAYTIGYTFQKEMLESDIKDTKISVYIDERTNPQGRYKNAEDFRDFESRCKDYFGEFGSWQGFKEKGSPKDVEDFNEGRHDATADHYRAVANEMAFEASLDRSDKSIESMEKGLQEVYLAHHHSIDAHDIFNEEFKRLESKEIDGHA